MAPDTLWQGACQDSSALQPRSGETRTGDFLDRRVGAIPPTHTANPRYYGPDEVVVHQAFDGPTFIVVGADVPDERLRHHLPELSKRYGASLDALQAARGGKQVLVRTG